MMQNRYVGDIGDFVKLALLRALSPGYRLGVVWYLVPDEAHNDDGRHIGYLYDQRWRQLDPELFDYLSTIVRSNERSVEALERSSLLIDCKFMSDILPLPKTFTQRHNARVAWLEIATTAICNRNLVFLDPDNGLEPHRFSPTRKKAIKSVSFKDLDSFREQGRTLIVYHHHTRRLGGHKAEIGYHADRLRENGFKQVDVLRARPYSPRAFFLLNATREIRERAKKFAQTWGVDRVTWYEDPTEN